MPANLAAMLRSLLRARQAASMTELRFLTEIARSLGAGGTNVARASQKSAPMKGRRRTLKCPRCKRRFARPVHLGRHLSATHGVKMKRAA
jgi:hypothetical protein